MDIVLPLSAALTAAVLILTYQQWLRYRYSKAAKNIQAIAPVVEKDPYDAIEPRSPDFDWATTPEIKLRTFKPKYHLTMCECHA